MQGNKPRTERKGTRSPRASRRSDSNPERRKQKTRSVAIAAAAGRGLRRPSRLVRSGLWGRKTRGEAPSHAAATGGEGRTEAPNGKTELPPPFPPPQRPAFLPHTTEQWAACTSAGHEAGKDRDLWQMGNRQREPRTDCHR